MPRQDSACSCYLVQTDETAVALDFGSGAVGKLQSAIDLAALDAIVITHMHPDHFFDLVPLRYGLKYAQEPRKERLALWLPPEGHNSLNRLSEFIEGGSGRDFFTSVFDVREYDPGAGLKVKNLCLTFALTRHYIAAFAIRAQRNGRAITYSADTAPCEAVTLLARDSAVFLCEAALGLEAEEEEKRGHCAAFEAGEMANRAAVERLVLTHYPAKYAPEALVAAAKQRFCGPVEAAFDGLQLNI